MTFKNHGIILVKIVNRSTIDDQHECHDEKSNTYSMKKMHKTLTIRLFLKFLPITKESFNKISVFHLQKDCRERIKSILKYNSQKVSRFFKMKVANYVLIVDILYRRHVIGVFLKYVGIKQALLVMFEVYKRLYEAHQSKIKIGWLITNQGFHWTSITNDCFSEEKKVLRIASIWPNLARTIKKA